MTGSPRPVDFTVGAVAAAELERLSAETMYINATAHRVRVTLRDEFANPVPGQTVRFELSGLPQAAMTPADGELVTEADGSAVIPVAATAAGTAVVGVTVLGTNVVASPASVPLRFAASTISASKSEYWTSTGTRIADGSETSAGAHRLWVHVRDVGGADVVAPGLAQSIDVTVAGAKGAAALGPDGFAPVAEAPGVYTALLTSTVADVMDVTVDVNGAVAPASGSDGTLTWVPGPVDRAQSVFAVDPGPVEADDAETVEVRVVLRDGQGNEVPGRASDLEGLAPPGTVSGFDGGQSGSGVYTAQIRSAVAGQFAVAVNLTGDRGGAIGHGTFNATARFQAGAPAGNSALKIVSSGSRYVASQFHTAEVAVLDAKGNAVPGAAVTFAVPGARVWAGGNWTVLADRQGKARLDLTADAAGQYSVSATVIGAGNVDVPVNGSGAVVEFVDAPADLGLSHFEVSQGTAVVADGNPDHYQEVEVWVSSAEGVGVAGRADALEGAIVEGVGAQFVDIDAAASGFQQFIAKPGAPVGTYIARIASVKAGRFTVTVSAAEGPVQVTAPGRDVARFVAGPADAGRSRVRVLETSVPVGGEIPVEVLVFDAQDNPVPYQFVQVSTDPVDAINPDGGTLPFLRVQSGIDGVAHATLSTEVANVYTVLAELFIGGGAPNQAVEDSGLIDVEFTAGALSADTTILTGSTGAVASDTEHYHWAKVNAKDEFGNNLSGRTVSFELADPAGATPIGQLADGYTASLLTDADGNAEVRYTGNWELGSTLLTATVDGMDVTNGSPTATPASLEWVWAANSTSSAESWYELSTGFKVADGVQAHQIQVKLFDENGSPVVGEAANLTVSATPTATSDPRPAGSGWTVPAHPTAVPGQPGSYTAELTSTYAATFDIAVLHTLTGAVQPDPKLSPPRTSVAFEAGPISAADSYFEVSVAPPARVADGVAAHTLTAVVRDAAGNGVAGLNLAALDTLDPHSVEVSPFVSTKAGTYAADLTSLTAGTFAMAATARVGDEAPVALNPGTRNRQAVFVAGDACAAASTFTVTPKPAPGDSEVKVGRGAYELRVAVRDCTPNGNPVPGQAVVFRTDPALSPALGAAGDTVVTGEAGVASLTVTSEAAGTFSASGSLGGVEPAAGSPKNIVFGHGEPSATASTLTGTTGEARLANGSAFHTATVTVRDQFANPVAGEPVVFDIGSLGRAVFVQPAGLISGDGKTVTTTADSAGQCVVHIVSTEVGSARVTASLGDLTSGRPILASPGVPAALALGFVPEVVDAENSYYTVSDGDRIAGLESHTVSVTLRDANSAPVDLEDPAAQLAGTATPDAQVVNWRADPDPLHPATYLADVVSTKAGVKRVGVSAAGVPVGAAASGLPDDATVAFVPGAGAKVSFEVSQNAGVKADGTSFQTLSVTVVDQFDNALTTVAEDLQADGEAIAVSPFTWVDGHYEARVTSRKAGSHVVSVRFDGEPASPAGNRAAVFVAGNPSPGASTLTVSAGTVRAGDDSHWAQVQVLDVDGNPVQGQPVAFWTVPATTPEPLGASPASDADGIARVDFTSQTAGQYTVFAALGAAPSAPQPKNSGALSVTFAATDIDWTRTTLTATAQHKLVGNSDDPHRATVAVRDRFGNPVTLRGLTDQPLTVRFEIAGLAGAALSTSAPIEVDGAGTASVTVTSTAPGTARLTATVGATPVATPPWVDLVFATSAVAPSNSAYEVTAGGRKADGQDTHTLTVHLRDADGDGVQDAQDFIGATLTKRGSATGGPPTVSGFLAVPGVPGDYSATIASTMAATYDIEIRVGDPLPAAVGSPTWVQFDAGTPVASRSGFEVSDGVRVAGADPTEYHQVTVTLRDAHGNGVPGQAALLAASALPFAIGAFAAFDATANPGVYVAAITSTQAVSRTVAVSLGGTQPLSAGTANAIARFVPGPTDAATSKLEALTAGSKLVAAEYHTVRATAADANGNPIQGATVVFAAVPEIAAPAWNGTAQTDERGIAELTFTARTPGTYQIHALVADPDGSTQIVPTGSGEVAAEFHIGAANTDRSWYTVTADASKIANGIDAQTLTVFLADPAGTGIAGADAAALLVPGTDKPGPVFGAFVEELSQPGIYRSAVTSQVAGAFAVSLTTAGTPGTAIGLQQPSGNATTYFATGPAAQAPSRLDVSPPQQAVMSVATATATVADARGNAVANQVVRFWVEDAVGTALEPIPGVTYIDMRTNGTGSASMDFTSDRAGLFTVFAAIVGVGGGSNGVQLPGSGDLTVLFTALREMDPAVSSLTGTDGESKAVGGQDPAGVHTVTAAAFDGSPAHNPIPDLNIEFRLSGGGTALTGDPLTALTGPDGVARLRIVSDVAGRTLVAARAEGAGGQWIDVPAVTSTAAGGSSPADHLVLRFDPGVWDAAASEFSVSEGDKVADGVASHQIAVTLRDTLGNGVPAMAEALSGAASPADRVRIGRFAPIDPNSDPFDGRYVASIVATVPGVKAISVRVGDQAVPPGGGANTRASFVARPASLTTSKVVVQDPRTVLIGGDATNPAATLGGVTTALVTMMDADGGLIGKAAAGLDVRLVIDLEGAKWSNLNGTPGKMTDRGDGTYAARLTSSAAGLATVRFTLAGAAASSSDQVQFIATPAPPVVKPSDGSQLTGTGDPGATVTVTTEAGQPVGVTTVGPDGTWSLTPSPALSEGTMVTVVQTSPSGGVSKRTTWRIGLPKVLVDRPDLSHGETQTARAVNFQPGEEIQATAYSTPLSLGMVVADSDGAAVFAFPVTDGFDIGEHRVEATGPLSGQAVIARFNVKAQPSSTPKDPGQDKSRGPSQGGGTHPSTGLPANALPVLIGGAVALVAGLVLVLAAAARRRGRD
ncbi:MAG: Ig-like domain-containing protein [Bifidobacteriaceae bacterium]|nr:Ig-like domain-containing protein [Bifidobacteriaceae bacterium]